MHKIIAALAAALLIAAPLAASAQDDPPSYASGSADAGDGQIRGRIVSFDGAYNLQVRDDKGYIDNVELHQGTIINPTGLTLAPGMVVSILGYNAGDNFAANEIDTPYTYYGGYAYYGGHPWNYWGPTVSLGFFFGNVGWWHGYAFGGPYHYYGGVRVYSNIHYNTVYRGGTYNNYGGHYYVASPERGGYVAPHGYQPQGGYRAPQSSYHGDATYRSPQGGGYQGGGYRAPQGGYHGGGAERGGGERGGGERGGGGDHGHR